MQWNDAESEYKRALELNPNDASAHLGFAEWLLSQGRTEEAQAWTRRARELDPFGVTGNSMGWSYSNPVTTMKPFASCEAIWRCTRMTARLTGSWGSR